MTAISILSVLGAIAATVLAFIFFVPEKRGKNLRGIGKLVHNTVNFKFLIVEKVLQALYIFCTATVVLMGFFMFFYVEPGYDGYYYSRDPMWYGGYGILTIITGPIAVRLVFELMMMAFLLVKNVIEINNKLGATEQTLQTNPLEGIVETAPAAEAEAAAPAPAVCPVCRNPVGEEAFCTTCGARLK